MRKCAFPKGRVHTRKHSSRRGRPSVPVRRCARDHKCAQKTRKKVPSIGVLERKVTTERIFRLEMVEGRACEEARRGVGIGLRVHVGVWCAPVRMCARERMYAGVRSRRCEGDLACPDAWARPCVRARACRGRRGTGRYCYK